MGLCWEMTLAVIASCLLQWRNYQNTRRLQHLAGHALRRAPELAGRRAADR
jgi:hypothetical protein